MNRGTNQKTVSNLSPGRLYEFMVLSQDRHGDGMFSKAIRISTKGTSVKGQGLTLLTLLIVLQALGHLGAELTCISIKFSGFSIGCITTTVTALFVVLFCFLEWYVEGHSHSYQLHPNCSFTIIIFTPHYTPHISPLLTN